MLKKRPPEIRTHQYKCQEIGPNMANTWPQRAGPKGPKGRARGPGPGPGTQGHARARVPCARPWAPGPGPGPLGPGPWARARPLGPLGPALCGHVLAMFERVGNRPKKSIFESSQNELAYIRKCSHIRQECFARVPGLPRAIIW